MSTSIIADAKPKLSTADTQWDAYFNNKIDYTFHQLSTTIEDVYREMMQNDCKLNREILRTKMALVATNPDMSPPTYHVMQINTQIAWMVMEDRSRNNSKYSKISTIPQPHRNDKTSIQRTI